MQKLQLTAVALFVAAQSMWSIPALAQAVERLPDKDVRKAIDQADQSRDKFENSLDGNFKNSIVRGANGDAKVSNVLQDYQDNTKKLKERFKDDYPAVAEAATVLRQAGNIALFMQGVSSATKGHQEWDAHAASLKYLAEAYGFTFPLPAGATLRRTNDKELAAAADAVSEAAHHFRDDVDRHPALPQSFKDTGKNEVDLLIKRADLVKDHVNDSKPATADARQLTQQAARVQAFVDAQKVSTANWEHVLASLATVRKAFGLTE